MLNRHFHSLVLISHLHTSLSVDTQQSACINLNCTTSLLYSNLYVFNSIDNTAAITDLTLIGALVVTHAMLRRLINCRFLLLFIIIIITDEVQRQLPMVIVGS